MQIGEFLDSCPSNTFFVNEQICKKNASLNDDIDIESEKTGDTTPESNKEFVPFQLLPKEDYSSGGIENLYMNNQTDDINYERERIIYENRNTKKKRGRKKKGDISDGTSHKKKKKDNKKLKIKNHFFNFLFHFSNGIIKGDMFQIHNIKFRKISYAEKSKNTIEINYDLLQNKTFLDLLKFNVSPKYLKKQESNKTSLDKLTKRLENKKKEDKMNNLSLDKYAKWDNYCNTKLKDIYKTIYLARDVEKIIEEYQIPRTKRKIEFFFEFLEKLRKKEEESYINALMNEGLDFIEDYERKMLEKDNKEKKSSFCFDDLNFSFDQ